MDPTNALPAKSEPDRLHMVMFGLSGLLLILAFAPTMRELVAEWIARPEYSHGFLMPLVAGWMLWERRAELQALKPDSSIVGVLLLLPCLTFLLLGEMKLSWFLKPYALVGALGAFVWAFFGWKGFRLCLPALVALLLMCPLPGRVQRGVTLPLKNSAALLATGMLDATGIPATLEGNLIHVTGIDDLWVANACSGIRSLISLASIAILACFFWSAHWAIKGVVLVSTVPVAIFVNGLRIWLTGVMSVKIGPDAARGFFHFFEGLALFAFAAVILVVWAKILRLVVEPGGDR